MNNHVVLSVLEHYWGPQELFLLSRCSRFLQENLLKPDFWIRWLHTLPPHEHTTIAIYRTTDPSSALKAFQSTYIAHKYLVPFTRVPREQEHNSLVLIPRIQQLFRAHISALEGNEWFVPYLVGVVDGWRRGNVQWPREVLELLLGLSRSAEGNAQFTNYMVGMLKGSKWRVYSLREGYENLLEAIECERERFRLERRTAARSCLKLINQKTYTEENISEIIELLDDCISVQTHYVVINQLINKCVELLEKEVFKEEIGKSRITIKILKIMNNPKRKLCKVAFKYLEVLSRGACGKKYLCCISQLFEYLFAMFCRQRHCYSKDIAIIICNLMGIGEDDIITSKIKSFLAFLVMNPPIMKKRSYLSLLTDILFSPVIPGLDKYTTIALLEKSFSQIKRNYKKTKNK